MNIQQAVLVDPTLTDLIDHFGSKDINCLALKGGLTNHCWRVTVHGMDYVWRPDNNANQRFGVSRLQEKQCLESIWQSSLQVYNEFISPRVIVHLPQGLLLEWLHGNVLTIDTKENHRQSLISTLNVASQLHALPVVNTSNIPVFNFTQKVDEYWQAINTAPNMREHITLELIYLYKQWREHENSSLSVVWCHLDLGFYNLIKTPQGIKAIDWEYAALTDPAMELALITQIYDCHVITLVDIYLQSEHRYGNQNREQWIKRVSYWLPKVRLLAVLWYLVAYQDSMDDQYLLAANQIKSHFCY